MEFWIDPPSHEISDKKIDSTIHVVDYSSYKDVCDLLIEWLTLKDGEGSQFLGLNASLEFSKSCDDHEKRVRAIIKELSDLEKRIGAE